jgi:hypothetical protein
MISNCRFDWFAQQSWPSIMEDLKLVDSIFDKCWVKRMNYIFDNDCHINPPKVRKKNSTREIEKTSSNCT